ncbi:nickel-dependent hydrogenase large subunit [Rhodoplanes sp. TEM]|uniref:Nickel-dependent hydrogenase large subunit n=1 Tax=Rhodoplanes tepidamans TaxID=200616 RepID=A0ABT5JBN3_RHOTP|nr:MULTISPECIES: nickel-dependent hydrogenase large subunit [Rhodoplanes]MDC7787007.1 nickel-dependent hydrogenase large subunit [Rhodoplanes tepidamans]MDC7987015.1 nickel-dependent hydrogenase large subunit [Rhodoplanes sp. TEM]MDQ0354268.1 hydrogenase large subunit [Rhodoplanes tepidamans]
MTRLVVGPFNRVEGDLELTLDVADGAVAAARVSAPLFRGFERILVGRPPEDALAIVPRICGICSVSQSMAAAAALRAAMGVTPPPNGGLAADLAHAAENIADHLSHFYLFFMPDFCRAEYAGRPWFEAITARFKAVEGSAAGDLLPARARLLHVVGILAGKWPHALAFRPGGTTRAVDLGETMRLVATVAQLRRFLERTLFAAPLDAVAALADPAALNAFAEASSSRGGDFAAFLRIAGDLDLQSLGRGTTALMSYGAYRGGGEPLFRAGVFDPATGEVRPVAGADIREDTSSAWLAGGPAHPAEADTHPAPDKPGAYGWSKAPRLAGEPVEVGALARQVVDGLPLARALIDGGGSNVLARVVARLVEVARVALAMERWVGALDPGQPFSTAAPPVSDAAADGLVEAARGSLGHWITIQDGEIARYQIISPTTWNFSPRDSAGVPGPLEQALVGTAVGERGAGAAAIQHVVRSFDPCMVCTAH